MPLLGEREESSNAVALLNLTEIIRVYPPAVRIRHIDAVNSLLFRTYRNARDSGIQLSRLKDVRSAYAIAHRYAKKVNDELRRESTAPARFTRNEWILPTYFASCKNVRNASCTTVRYDKRGTSRRLPAITTYQVNPFKYLNLKEHFRHDFCKTPSNF